MQPSLGKCERILIQLSLCFIGRELTALFAVRNKVNNIPRQVNRTRKVNESPCWYTEGRHLRSDESTRHQIQWFPEFEATTSRQYQYNVASRSDYRERSLRSFLKKYVLRKLGSSKRGWSFILLQLLTGATGSLGAHVLNELLKETHDDIQKIVCLVRRTDGRDPRARVFHSFEERGIPTSILQANARSLHFFNFNLIDDSLGLSDEDFDFITSSDRLTVIHAAWTVNFLEPLSRFETENLKGAYLGISELWWLAVDWWKWQRI